MNIPRWIPGVRQSADRAAMGPDELTDAERAFIELDEEHMGELRALLALAYEIDHDAGYAVHEVVGDAEEEHARAVAQHRQAVPIAYKCFACGAEPGEACVSAAGRPYSNESGEHSARRRRAARLAALGQARRELAQGVAEDAGERTLDAAADDSASAATAGDGAEATPDPDDGGEGDDEGG